MRITAITKFKQGDMYQALKKAGWTQSELARRCGVLPGIICGVINMKRRPSCELADKIQRAFAAAGVFVDVLSAWPEEFAGFVSAPVLEQTRDIGMDRILASSSVLALDGIYRKEKAEVLDSVLRSLQDRDRTVLERIYFDGATRAEVAAEQRVSRPRIRAIEFRAIRRLQHPERIRMLEELHEERRGTG